LSIFYREKERRKNSTFNDEQQHRNLQETWRMNVGPIVQITGGEKTKNRNVHIIPHNFFPSSQLEE
jgi:hypothetical protein